MRKMEILQFSLLASEEIRRGRNIFLAINSNLFEKDWQFTIDYTIPGESEDKRIRTEKAPGRKIFRTYLKELLDERFLVRIHTSDDRAKWYSITPLGICQLIKSEQFFDGIKMLWPERINAILILMTFAIPNVKEYRSLIFGKQKFLTYDTNLWKDLINSKMSIREELPHVLSNIEISKNSFTFYVTNGVEEENKIRLASGHFNNDLIQEDNSTSINRQTHITELDKKWGIVRGDPKYSGLSLDEDQFHHYFANLLICSLIYDYTIAKFDIIQNRNILNPQRGKNKKIKTEKEFGSIWNNYPEYFQRIVVLFSNHITKILSKQIDLMTDFSRVLK